MGGSLAAACRSKFPKAHIVGVSRNPQALTLAKKKGWIHQGSRMLADAANCDLAVLCTPVDAFKEALIALDRHATRSLLVTDVGSVKGDICRFVDTRRWNHLQFVGAHPMVGSHKQGVHAAIPTLYDKGLVFVTPGTKSSLGSTRQITAFWTALSVRIVKISPRRHDEIVSQISHLPHAIAACLMLAVDRKNMKYVGSGFRDVTRIAASHPSIWAPIFLTNRTALTRQLKIYEKSVKALRLMISVKDEAKLRKALKVSSAMRLEI